MAHLNRPEADLSAAREAYLVRLRVWFLGIGLLGGWDAGWVNSLLPVWVHVYISAGDSNHNSVARKDGHLGGGRNDCHNEQNAAQAE